MTGKPVDAFAPSADMLPAEDAVARLLNLVAPVSETERVPLREARGPGAGGGYRVGP